MLGIFSAAEVAGLILVFAGTKGLNQDQPRSWRAVRGSLLGFGVCLMIALVLQWLLGLHGIEALMNPFLFPVAISAKLLLIEINKPAPRLRSTSSLHAPSLPHPATPYTAP